MSDTHDLHFRVDPTQLPPADIFIHAGDFTKISAAAELTRFREFLNLLPYKHKVVIAGNHDFALDKISYEKSLRQKKHLDMGGQAVDTEEEIKKLKAICTYLEHESVTI
jgi:predicted phosphodiesterase